MCEFGGAGVCVYLCTLAMGLPRAVRWAKVEGQVVPRPLLASPGWALSVELWPPELLAFISPPPSLLQLLTLSWRRGAGLRLFSTHP